MCKGVAHALDYDFRLVPPAMMAPLQRRLEGNRRNRHDILDLPACSGRADQVLVAVAPHGFEGAPSSAGARNVIWTRLDQYHLAPHWFSGAFRPVVGLVWTTRSDDLPAPPGLGQ